MQIEITQVLTLFFVLLVGVTLYSMMKMFTYIDPVQFHKRRFLGLFALLFPGVLKEGGSVAFLIMTIVAMTTFLFGLYLFEFREW